MYLNSPSTTNDFQLLFQIGPSSSTTRSWRIRISFLPCTSRYLGILHFKFFLVWFEIHDLLIKKAPADCLQYFTQTNGIVKSFNWKESISSASAPRQLANQDYNICFRTEQITISPLSSSVILYSHYKCLYFWFSS